MKVELISPNSRESSSLGKWVILPPLNLALLGGMILPDIDITISDDLIQPINFAKETDLVGISVNTNSALRAYEIADKFRSRGVPVVMGGSHPTVVQQEAIQHADAVVIGEAEGVWLQVLDDCKKGRLKKFYRSNRLPSLENSPLPRRELFQPNKYNSINVVQFSRGCPFSCEFCSISTIYGKKVRLRPVDEVIAEIKTLRGKELLFADDNIFGRPEYAKQLFTRLTPLKKKWIGQASVTVADKEENLELLRKSGCQALYIGFETTSLDGLKEIGKYQNITNNYIETIKKVKDNGIILLATFMLGFDCDDKSCFERLLDFLEKSKLETALIGVLVPYPGTLIYKKLQEENRLIDDKWWFKYDGYDVVYKPKLMTRDELIQGYTWTVKEFYKLRPTMKRWIKGVLGRPSILGNILNWRASIGYRRWKLGHFNH